MPTREQWEAAHPRCPTRHGSMPALQHHCLKPMFNDPLSEQWICPRCGPAMTWTSAARRLRSATGQLFYEEEAA